MSALHELEEAYRYYQNDETFQTELNKLLTDYAGRPSLLYYAETGAGQQGVAAATAGATLDGVFDMVASIKDKVRIPLVFMTYLNPVFVYGVAIEARYKISNDHLKYAFK